MKTIAAIGLTVLLIVVLVVGVRAYLPSPISGFASASQIFIHGTPVCVYRHGESIVARLGECAGALPRDGAREERLPEVDGPESGLPPGHPPVGPDMLPDGDTRRILI